MYKTTDAYLRTMNLPDHQRYRLGGSIGGVKFSDDNVLADSVYISNQASGSTDVTLGGVNIGKFEAVFVDLPIPRGTWENRKIENLKIEFQTDEGNWEEIPFQDFTIVKAEHTDSGVSIEASDAMARFDGEVGFDTTSGMPYDIVLMVCKKASVPFGMTREEVEALPNGKENWGMYPENDIKTNRDAIYWIAQTLGCFATINRSGALVFRRFTTTGARAIPAEVRFEGGTYSDFVTRYTGLSVVEMETDETKYYGLPLDNGLTMNLGSNPFLQFGTTETKDAMRKAILQEISRINFTPYGVDIVPDPAIDLGDILTFPDYNGAGVRGCVMAYELHYKNSLTIEGFGSNPSLASAQSKADKDIAGLRTQTQADVLTFFGYVNAQGLEVGETRQQVAELKVTNTKSTFVDFWVEMKMAITLEDAETPLPAIVRVSYTKDDELEVYGPVMTVSHEGVYTFNFLYYWKLEEILQHSFKVFLEVENGTATIEPADLHALIKGQGMTEGKAWDGLIEITDVFSLSNKGKMAIPFTDETPTTELKTPTKLGAFTDEFELAIAGFMACDFEDSAEVITQTGIFDLVTQDGRQLVTQNGDPFITNGGSI